MSDILATHRPHLRKGFRLQWEEAQGAHVLLYPEGMVKLNRSAGEIMIRCDGATTFAELVCDLERAFSRNHLAEEVRGFLAHAFAQRWIDFS